MGNTMVLSCCQDPSTSTSSTKLIFWEGTTRIITGKKSPIAGEIMFEFPDRMVCHADSFFIGQPIPALAIEDELLKGQTYFVLPLDCFSSCGVLSASAFSALVSSSCSPANRKTNPSINSKDTPFEYIKGSNGKVLIKVSPEFMIKIMRVGKENDDQVVENNPSSFLCSTPELKKHYDMLVGSKGQMWSPKLDTISEYKNVSKFSPCRFMVKTRCS